MFGRCFCFFVMSEGITDTCFCFTFSNEVRKSSRKRNKKDRRFFCARQFNEVKCRTFPLLAYLLSNSYKCCIIYFNVFKSVRHLCTTFKVSDKYESVRHNTFDDQTIYVLFYRLIFRPHKKRPSINRQPLKRLMVRFCCWAITLVIDSLL